MPAAARIPRTQQQRRDETRRAILDAAVDSLVKLGFAKTTTLEVQRRAEVSRGALLHHFPSKAGLLAATIEHLAEMRGRELRDLEVKLPAGKAARAGAAIDLLWESVTGPLFYVAMDLRAAARTDPELRRALAVAEMVVHERIKHQCRDLFGVEIAGHPGFECALDITLQMMIGAGMTAILHGEQARIELLVEEWKTLFPTLLEAPQGSKRRTR
jgi:AcrR family transcriptional regulator